MNLVDINLKNQNITNNELQISKIKMKDGKYILGFRAEDARIEENEISVDLYIQSNILEMSH